MSAHRVVSMTLGGAPVYGCAECGASLELVMSTPQCTGSMRIITTPPVVTRTPVAERAAIDERRAPVNRWIRLRLAGTGAECVLLRSKVVGLSDIKDSNGSRATGVVVEGGSIVIVQDAIGEIMLELEHPSAKPAR